MAAGIAALPSRHGVAASRSVRFTVQVLKAFALRITGKLPVDPDLQFDTLQIWERGLFRIGRGTMVLPGRGEAGIVVYVAGKPRRWRYVHAVVVPRDNRDYYYVYRLGRRDGVEVLSIKQRGVGHENSA